MYEEFYGLKENPFGLTPDPKFLFLSEKHKEVFSHLIYGIQQRKGFIEITGEVGTGKTTLCRALLNKVDEKTRTALILNPILSRIELLKSILEDLGLESEGESEKELLERLNKFLIEELSGGGNVVIIIDESQDLTSSLLEEIRLLSNLETEKEKLLQIILVGQPELHHKLNSPNLRQLNQRIAVRYHLTALGEKQTRDYIYYRLKVAGSQGNIKFTSRALKRIYAYSGGIPRMINILADKALLAGYISETKRITSGIVKRAIKEIRGERLGKKNFLSRELPRGLAFALIILGIGLTWFWRSEMKIASVKREGLAPPEETTLPPPAPGQRQVVLEQQAEAEKIDTLTDLAKSWGDYLLYPGMLDPKVVKLQECLSELGYYKGPFTGYFRRKTEKAVTNFQKDNQIKVDGLVGPETKAALYYRLLNK
jgi:general secretion pathway protein A